MRRSRFDLLPNPTDRPTGIKNVVDDQDMPTLERIRQEHAAERDTLTGGRSTGIAGSRDEPDPHPQRQFAHQIGHEGDASGHDRNEHETFVPDRVGEILRDLPAEFPDPPGDRLPVNQNAIDVLSHDVIVRMRRPRRAATMKVPAR